MDLSEKPMLYKYSLFLFFVSISIGYVSCNIDIKEISLKLSEDIQALKNEELGIPFIEKLYDNFKYISNNGHKTQKSVQEMANKLESKMLNVFSAMHNASLTLEYIISSKLVDIPSTLIPCIEEESGLTEILINSNFIDNETLHDFPGIRSVLYQARKNMSSIKNAIKQEYFISSRDLTNVYYYPFSECNGHDERIIWSNYMRRNKYRRKNIILVLDHGGSLSKRQFQIVKMAAKYIVSNLNKKDRIVVLGIASDWSHPFSNCAKATDVPSLKEANLSYVEILNSYIDSLVRGNGATNHTLGIQRALEIVNSSKDLSNELVMVLYISRGLLSSLTEARTVLETMAKYEDNLDSSLIINTCAVIDDSKPVMYETHFLRDIAEQNYTKYNISYEKNDFHKIGFLLTINKTGDIAFVVNQFFNVFNWDLKYYTGAKLSLPNWDPISGDLTVSFSIGWGTGNNQFLLLGSDIYFSNIAEDVTYYSSNQQFSYTFMMDMNGIVIMHPSIPRPSMINHQVSFVDIMFLEKVEDITKLREKLLTEPEGTHFTMNNQSRKLEYNWKRVGEWYVICVVTDIDYGEFNKPFKALPSPSVSKLLYQSFDSADEYKLCRHLNQIATLDVASLYLSMSCFQSPYSASRTTQDKLIVQGYLAYLKDDTGMLINPGLKKEVRDEASALAHVLDFLRKRHLSSSLSKYIVRRFASSYSGVLQMFPGTVLTPGLETTKSPWFSRALQHRGKTVFISPYLDKGGAGYIVTLAYATAHAVVAVDVTYGYILKLLLKHMPFCLNEKITCFLIDDQGYIVYHPNIMDINEARPVEQQHIVHRESFVANDILNHKHFIRKILCNNFADRTIQRYYRLNTSFTDVLVNFVPGEHCVTYRITAVPNTNMFLGVVNASCDVVATFCPCSIVDRLCLNCNRMEQKECECPCECPLDADNSCQEVSKNMTDNPPCMWNSESTSVDASFPIYLDSHLDSCFPVNCQGEKTHIDCLGLIGCEWCQYDMDGNGLKKPFCSSISSCFNGVFGLSTPYRANIGESSLPNDSEYSPVGPILGSVIAMGVLFVLLFICYRSYTNPSVDRLYLSSTQDQLRMSDLNINDTYHDLGNHKDKLLTEDCPNPVSPYCVASTYRRANTAADSDHGYSTMTPHDESEHLSLAPVEVDSLEDDVMSDSTSVHTSVSAKNNCPRVTSPPMFTRIPNRNCVVVPVTVHRNMEAT